jgi:hypothetical protein
MTSMQKIPTLVAAGVLASISDKTTHTAHPTALLTRARAMPATSIYPLRTMPSADYGGGR